jgi:hypothetical protein
MIINHGMLPIVELNSLIVITEPKKKDATITFEVTPTGWTHVNQDTICVKTSDFACANTPFALDDDGVIFKRIEGGSYSLQNKRFVFTSPQSVFTKKEKEYPIVPSPCPELPHGTILFRATHWCGVWQKLILRRSGDWASSNPDHSVSCPHRKLCPKKLPTPLAGGDELHFKGEKWIYNITEKEWFLNSKKKRS